MTRAVALALAVALLAWATACALVAPGALAVACGVAAGCIVLGGAHLLAPRRAAEHIARTTDLEQRHEATLAMVHARSEFTASLCHEIRTSLNGLLGFLSLLAESAFDEQQRDWVGIARSSGESLLALLDDVLDLAKVEAGKLTLERTEFDCDEVFESVAGLFAPAAQAKGVELLLDVDADVPRLIGDPVRLRQVVANLVSNAVKFTSLGTVEVIVSAGERTGSRLVLEIRVLDSGVGIAPERLARLFTPFEQADASTTRRFGGTGLGLSIVKHIVEQMAGAVSVESQVGRGTRFRLRLPLEVAAESPAPPAQDPLLLLIVDAHARRRELLAKTLRRLTSEVAAVADPAAGCDRLRAWADRADRLVVLADDAVTLDDGLRAAVRARPDSRLIVLRDPSAAHDAVADGVDCVLVRPLRRARLLAAIAGEEHAAAGVRTAAPPTWPGRRVLLVEDDLVNQRLMCVLLTRLGVEVVLATDGEQSVAAFSSYTFDLVLMDVQLPAMDGFQATQAIRAIPPAGASVPIVGLTASADTDVRDQCLAAGMNDHVAKPVRAGALREVLARWMPAETAALAGH